VRGRERERKQWRERSLETKGKIERKGIRKRGKFDKETRRENVLEKWRTWRK
jgi:hypothetical protein